jgi:ribosome-binding factor A
MAHRRKRAAAGPSQRQLRVGEGLRHVLAELLLRGELHDPLLAASHLTVAEVRVTPDLRHATAYVTELGGRLRPAVRQALERAAPRLRGEAARRLHLKYAPELTFRADPSFEEAARIEGLLATERRTLERWREDDDGTGQA